MTLNQFNKSQWFAVFTLIFFTLLMMLSPLAAAKKPNKMKYSDEYSGRHNAKNIHMAITSKGFAWLSGSPADNEKLSIGKSAQFFGFVALRYQSDRAARRGDLGRAFHELATDEQRQFVKAAVLEVTPVMKNWWQVRTQILRDLEAHLYTGEKINEAELLSLGERFGLINGQAGLIEANACAAVERTLSQEQKNTLAQLRQNQATASQSKSKGKGNKQNKAKKQGKSQNSKKTKPRYMTEQQQSARYEDIFAKCFSYLTGTLADREIIPLGQPAQFFGFVSIRHKSGHGAKRGKISKQFYKILNSEQRKYLQKATNALLPEIQDFKEIRRQLLIQMDTIRVYNQQEFSPMAFEMLAKRLGHIELRIAIFEAMTYRKIQQSMNDGQQQAMMAIRSNYIINDKTTQQLTGLERGEKLYQLCVGCHDESSDNAPSLHGVINRGIASKSFAYSNALLEKNDESWSRDNLDSFIKSPAQAIPGNKMGFSGLLNAGDRKALIDYLATLD